MNRVLIFNLYLFNVASLLASLGLLTTTSMFIECRSVLPIKDAKALEARWSERSEKLVIVVFAILAASVSIIAVSLAIYSYIKSILKGLIASMVLHALAVVSSYLVLAFIGDGLEESYKYEDKGVILEKALNGLTCGLFAAALMSFYSVFALWFASRTLWRRRLGLKNKRTSVLSLEVDDRAPEAVKEEERKEEGGEVEAPKSVNEDKSHQKLTDSGHDQTSSKKSQQKSRQNSQGNMRPQLKNT